MSSISSPQKRSFLWKVSGSSKNINKEHTQQSYRLPQKFSPSKRGLNESSLFSFSTQKVRLSRINQQKQGSMTPRKEGASFVRFESGIGLRSSTQMMRMTPQKQQLPSKIAFLSKDSFASMSSEQLVAIKQQAMKDMINQYDHNRRLILELKNQFNKFKSVIIEEIQSQKDIMLQIVQEISKKISSSIIENQTFSKKISIHENQFEQNIIKIAAQLDQYEKNNFNIQQKVLASQQQIEEIITIQNIKSQQYLSPKQAQNDFKQEKEVSLKYVKSQQQLCKIYNLEAESKVFVENIEQPLIKITPRNQLEINPTNEPIIESPKASIKNFPSQIKPTIKHQKDSPDLLKCSQIVETINTLHQINDSPVDGRSKSKQKSLQKKAIQQYKQKLQELTKIRDKILQREPKPNGTEIDHKKMKGSFKLDKFYNAIEKLKLQVNQIKHISEIKHTPNGRILQYQ